MNSAGTTTEIDPIWNSKSPSSSFSMLSTFRQSCPPQHLVGYQEWATARRAPETAPPNAKATASGTASATAVPACKIGMSIPEACSPVGRTESEGEPNPLWLTDQS